MELYPDQQDLVHRLRSAYGRHRRVVLCLPTGAGKTVMASWLMKRVHEKGKRAMVLAHREELIQQFFATANALGLAHEFGIVSAGRAEQAWKPHHLCMVQTLVRRLERTRIEPDLIVIDECHHAAAKTYRKILDRWPNAHLLGLSATPERPDGKPMDDIFEAIVQGPSTGDYIGMGRLAPFECWVPNIGFDGEGIRTRGGDYKAEELEKRMIERKVVAKVVDNILRFGEGRRWIAFFPTIHTSERATQLLTDAGVRCRHIDGQTDKWDRNRTLKDFREGGWCEGICNVNLLLEGIDAPSADCLFLVRPTKSHVVYLQAIGRVLRQAAGKVARIVDLAGVIELHGPPDMVREWDLAGRPDTKKKVADAQAGWRVCKHCFRYTPVSRSACEHCGQAPPPPPAKHLNEIEVEMVRAIVSPQVQDIVAHGGKVPMRQLQSMSHEAYRKYGADGLQALEKQLGYKRGWWKHRLKWMELTSQ